MLHEVLAKAIGSRRKEQSRATDTPSNELLFKRQRDEARKQREEMRAQRDIARKQRKAALRDYNALQDELKKQKKKAAQSTPAPEARERFGYHAFLRYIETGGREGKIPQLMARMSDRDRSFLAHDNIRPNFVFHTSKSPVPSDIAFAAVCNAKFLPGLEALILSLREIYPDLGNDFYVFHDGSLSEFSRARLLSLYGQFRFVEGDADAYPINFGDTFNHKRVGKLGYLNLEALRLAGYARVIVLDSDMIITGDLSPLWEGDDIRVVADIGVRPFGVVSSYTGRPIFNSGVLSIPSSLLGEDAYKQAFACIDTLEQCTCDILNSYADQKFWNIFLSRRPVTYLPNNFNSNKSLIEFYYPEFLGQVSVLHMTAAKPWYSFLHTSLLEEDDLDACKKTRKQFPQTFAAWDATYVRTLGRARRGAFLDAMGDELDRLKGTASGRTAVMIGNGPSLNRTDLSNLDGCVKVAFNWFVNHPEFDDIKPDHLILASHMFFGGWNTVDPHFPDGFLDALLGHTHKPTLWTSFYYKEYIDKIEALQDYKINYFLFEKPFKKHGDELGWINLDLSSFLSDNRTGVLTAGVPLATHLGCRRIVLVGCDSNYTRNAGGDYFYAQKRHTSLSTRQTSLEMTWQKGGPGPRCYQFALEQLRALGIELIDGTVGGTLDVLPKGDLQQLIAP